MPPLDFDDLKTAEREGPATQFPPCRNCDVVRDAAFCAQLASDDIKRLTAARCHAQLPANFTLFREGDAADHLYSVASGAVKLYKLMSDGRRQIIGFLFAGDLFGLAAHDGYAYTAETVSPSQVCRFGYRKLGVLMEELPRLERRMLALAIKDLMAAQEQMLLLGRKTAKEKVATFLLILSRRAQQRGLPPSPVALPMSRADIADHLGLTIETVSRTFTQLKRNGLIGLPTAGHAVLPDLRALKDLADGAGGSC